MAVPLRCDSCGADLDPDDVNLASMAAVCRSCNQVIDLDESRRHSRWTHSTTPEHEMAQEDPPKRVAAYQESGGLVILRRWYQHRIWPVVAFTAFWNLSMLMIYVGIFAAIRDGDDGAFDSLFLPLLHVAIGLYLIWIVLATLFNKTRIEIRSGTLSVKHGPMWWPAPGPIQTSELDQLYCVSRLKSDAAKPGYLELHARQRDGLTQKLLGNLPDLETARYIERRVESYLEVVDRPAAGELPRYS